MKSLIKDAKSDGILINNNRIIYGTSVGIKGTVGAMQGALRTNTLKGTALGTAIGVLAGLLVARLGISFNELGLRNKLLQHYKLGELTDEDIDNYITRKKVSPNLKNIIKAVSTSGRVTMVEG